CGRLPTPAGCAEIRAFDFVADAVAWAKRRFAESRVDYRTADLFALPQDWQGRFDLIHECYTLQALAPARIPQALAIFRNLLAPEGRLLIVACARDEDEDVAGPPWPLPPS